MQSRLPKAVQGLTVRVVFPQPLPSYEEAWVQGSGISPGGGWPGRRSPRWPGPAACSETASSRSSEPLFCADHRACADPGHMPAYFRQQELTALLWSRLGSSQRWNIRAPSWFGFVLFLKDLFFVRNLTRWFTPESATTQELGAAAPSGSPSWVAGARLVSQVHELGPGSEAAEA